MTEAGAHLTLEDITASAAHYVHSVNVNMQATLYPMTVESYRASVFLDNRIALPADTPSAQINFMDLCGQFPGVAGAETRYLFHISHVGSTLLSRLLGCKQSVLSLREPLLLRWLSMFKNDLGKPECRIDSETYQAFLIASLGLISRPLGGVDQVIVKPTSFTNTIAHDMLTVQPKARAVGIYSRLDAFVATILKGGGGWNDILELAPIRLKRLHDIIGMTPWQLSKLGAGEIVAMSWLAEMATLQAVADAAGPRFLWLDFDVYLASPDAQFAAMCRALNIGWSDADSAAASQSGLSQRYSKDSSVSFNSNSRKEQISAILAHHAGEVARARAWIDAAMATHPALGALASLF
jgi:hypothetical protein